jgi:hypothetical protein
MVIIPGDVYVECPGEAHEKDGDFNPSTQGPYGPGYHDCDVCDNECEITEEEYQEWKEWQQRIKEDREHRALIKKLEAAKKMNY